MHACHSGDRRSSWSGSAGSSGGEVGTGSDRASGESAVKGRTNGTQLLRSQPRSEGVGRWVEDEENTGFACVVCDEPVTALTNGGYRDHCPFCLSSIHVDEAPGDRGADCGGAMIAIGVAHAKKGGRLVHRCQRC
jgi:hypothetical protein